MDVKLSQLQIEGDVLCNRSHSVCVFLLRDKTLNSSLRRGHKKEHAGKCVRLTPFCWQVQIICCFKSINYESFVLVSQAFNISGSYTLFLRVIRLGTGLFQMTRPQRSTECWDECFSYVGTGLLTCSRIWISEVALLKLQFNELERFPVKTSTQVAQDF